MMLPHVLGQWLNPDKEGHELMHLLLPALPSPLEVIEVDPVINNSRHKTQPAPDGTAIQLEV